MNNNLFTYKAICVKVYDGDTITVNIDLGFGTTFSDQKLRLFGIDTPEIKGESKASGIIAKDRIRSLILDKEIIVKTHKDKKEKYGRYLADVFFQEGEEWIHLNELLVKENLAIRYMI